MTTPSHHGSAFPSVAPTAGLSRHPQPLYPQTQSAQMQTQTQSMNPQPAGLAKGLPSIPSAYPTVNNNRRVWVCRPGSTPTTVLVPPELIVDDLKTMILERFPVSLQRTTDPADLTIHLPPSAQQPLPPPPTPASARLSNSHLVSPSSPAISAAAAATATAASEESYRAASSPHHASFSLSLRKKQSAKPSPLMIKTPSQGAPPPTPQSHLGDPLSPDANVWQLLDLHFPQGMRMDEALVVDGHTVLPGLQVNQSVPPTPSLNQSTPPNHHQSHVVKQVITAHTNPHQSHAHTPSQEGFMGPPSALDDDSNFDDDTKPSRKRRDLGSSGQHSGPGVGAGSSASPSQSPAAAGSAQGGVLLLPRQFRGGARNSDKESSSARKKGSPPAPDDKRRQAEQQQQQQQKQQSQQTQQQQKSSHKTPAPIQKPVISLNARPNGATIRESPSNTNLEALGNKKKEDLAKEDTSKKPSQTAKKPELKRTRTPLSGKNPKGPTTMETIVPRVNVLIVEDNEINQKILEAFMRKRKIRSSVAKNGREALEKWRQGGFHLILMDIQLPVMSGILVTKEIRRLEHQNKIGVFSGESSAAQSSTPVAPEDVLDIDLFRSPVIIVALTASSLKEDKSEALAAGCNDFLTKPVNMVWLERKIMEWGCMQALIDFEGWKMWRGRDFDGTHTPAIGRALANTHLVQPVTATRSRSRSKTRLKRQNSGTNARSKLSMTPVASDLPNSPDTKAPPDTPMVAQALTTSPTSTTMSNSKNPEQCSKVEVPAK